MATVEKAKRSSAGGVMKTLRQFKQWMQDARGVATSLIEATAMQAQFFGRAFHSLHGTPTMTEGKEDV